MVISLTFTLNPATLTFVSFVIIRRSCKFAPAVTKLSINLKHEGKTYFDQPCKRQYI